MFGENSRVADDDCTRGEIVALDPEGREVARHPQPFCRDDLWVIRTEDLASS